MVFTSRTYTSIFYAPITGARNHMKTHPTNPFVSIKKMILHLNRTYIQGRLSMMEILWIKILGGYRTMKLCILLKIPMCRKIHDEFAGFL